MGITTGQNGNASDFIDDSSRNATPSNDSGKVAKLESDGKEHPFFNRIGFVPNAGETINGATLPVPVYQNDTDNEVYACDGNDTTKLKFIGFATSNGTNANPIDVQTNGIVPGFTGLAEGEKYFVQDTVGTIGTSPGTYSVLVGIAISQTELLIQRGRRYANGTFTIASNTQTDQVITLGFRPSVIRLKVIDTSTADVLRSEGVWENGNYAYIRTSVDEAGGNNYSGVGTSYIAEIVRTADGSYFHRFTVTSVTDTGFTFTDDETASFSSPAIAAIWEAEGEF